jgi:Recombinase zinc beta ribbon domain
MRKIALECDLQLATGSRMSARGKGGPYHYYACTARQKYGPKACQGQRVSREKLETHVNSKTDIQPTYRIVTPGVCATSANRDRTADLLLAKHLGRHLEIG